MARARWLKLNFFSVWHSQQVDKVRASPGQLALLINGQQNMRGEIPVRDEHRALLSYVYP